MRRTLTARARQHSQFAVQFRGERHGNVAHKKIHIVRVRTCDALEVAEDLDHPIWCHRVDHAGEEFDWIGLLLGSLHTRSVAVRIIHRRWKAIKLVRLVCSAVNSKRSTAKLIIVKITYCTLRCLWVPELTESKSLRLSIFRIFNEPDAKK